MYNDAIAHLHVLPSSLLYPSEETYMAEDFVTFGVTDAVLAVLKNFKDANQNRVLSEASRVISETMKYAPRMAKAKWLGHAEIKGLLSHIRDNTKVDEASPALEALK